jgi:hypothetical protein
MEEGERSNDPFGFSPFADSVDVDGPTDVIAAASRCVTSSISERVPFLRPFHNLLHTYNLSRTAVIDNNFLVSTFISRVTLNS